MQWLKGPIPHNVDNSVDKVDNSAKPGASLTPSPVIATIAPLRFHA